MEKAFENRVLHICALTLACQNQAYLKKTHNFQKHNFWLHNTLFLFFCLSHHNVGVENSNECHIILSLLLKCKTTSSIN